MPSPPADLSPSQWQAVSHRDGALLVLAGPGSGKTRVITRRIAQLIDTGVAPHQILAITFTNKAAREMASRLDHLIPDTSVFVSTFHRLCARLLRRYGPAVGLAQNFTILDSGDQTQLLRHILTQLNIDPVHYPANKMGYRISEAKSRVQTAEMMARGVAEQSGAWRDAIVSRVYTAYQRALLESNAVDFDDLLLHVCMLLAENEEVRSELDARFRYILVDEYQDTNLAQYRIVQALSVDYPNLCATGDPDQSIYGWRGAEIGNILRFEEDFPDASVVRLEQNYRSTKSILRVADALITHNLRRKQKGLFTDNPSGADVEALRFADEKREAEGIAQTIWRLSQDEERPWSHFALLYRVNALSRTLETALRQHGIPYQVAAGVSFYERAEVKDMLGYLRLVYNPSERPAFLRVVNTPLRGIGKSSVERLSEWAAEQGLNLLEAAHRATEVPELKARAANALKRFADLIHELQNDPGPGVEGLLRLIIERTGYTQVLRDSHAEQDGQRLANVEELLSAASQYDEEAGAEASLEGFLETASLVSDLDNLDADAGTVTLMTLHAAKGLEYPVVFVVAVEHGILPHERTLESKAQLEEERRLLFVGATRAQERLYLTQTIARDFRGSSRQTVPSDFLREMELKPTDYGISPEQRAAASGDFHEWCDPEVDYEAGEGDVDDEEAVVRPLKRRAPIDRRAAEDEWDGKSLDTDDSEAMSSFRPVRENRASPAAGKTFHLTTGAELLNNRPAQAETSPSFEVGMSVRHPRLGLGRVIASEGTGRRHIVKVEFQSGNTQAFFVHKSPLQPVGLTR